MVDSCRLSQQVASLTGLALRLPVNGTADRSIHQGPWVRPRGGTPWTESRATLNKKKWQLLSAVLVVAFFSLAGIIRADFQARDPGVRGGTTPGAGGHLTGLSHDELRMFTEGQAEFMAEEGPDEGLGPRFNFVACAG